MRSPVLRLALCGTLLLSSVSVPALAQKEGDKDVAELQHYTLTMDKANRYAEVFGDLSTYAQAHPDLSKKLEGESNESLAAAERRISSDPGVVAILAKHGFTPHDFILFGMVLFQASFASETAKQNGIDPAKMAAEAHVNPANMSFVQQHKTELEAVMAKMKAAEDKPKSQRPAASDESAAP